MIDSTYRFKTIAEMSQNNRSKEITNISTQSSLHISQLKCFSPSPCVTHAPPISSLQHRTLRITDYVAPIIFFCDLFSDMHANTHIKHTFLNSINYSDTHILLLLLFFLLFLIFFFYGATVWCQATACWTNSPPRLSTAAISQFKCPVFSWNPPLLPQSIFF
jgi:hypothetical protein